MDEACVVKSHCLENLLNGSNQYLPLAVGAIVGAGITMLSPFMTTVIMAATGAHVAKSIAKQGVRKYVENLIDTY